MNLIHKRGTGNKTTSLRRAMWLASSLIAIFFATSCSMINEDLPECADKPNLFLKVNFVYDYNMLNYDLFNQHVGSVYLYMFDEDSVFLYRRTKHRIDMGRNIDFTIAFDTTEVVPGHTYHFVAIAQGNREDYFVTETPGFTLQTQMEPGVSRISDYLLKLDRDDDGNADFGVVNYKSSYEDNTLMIDTLWSTKPDEVQTVRIPYIEHKPSAVKLPDDTIKVTVPMMRITNAINVNLVSDSFEADTDPKSYNILIDFPHGNGTIDFTGNTYPAQELYYLSLRKLIKEYHPKQNGAQYDTPANPSDHTASKLTRGSDGKTYCISADFGVSRLQVKDESSLQIRDAVTNDLIAEIPNFSDWLADYFDHHYDDQEFLDREYDFTVDIKLDGKLRMEWFQIGCSILGWGKRVQTLDW